MLGPWLRDAESHTWDIQQVRHCVWSGAEDGMLSVEAW